MIVDDGVDRVSYDNISRTRKDEHTIMAVVVFDGESDIYYGNHSGRMRHDIHRYFEDNYRRQPERVTLGMIIDE